MPKMIEEISDKFEKEVGRKLRSIDTRNARKDSSQEYRPYGRIRHI
jgi:hypothetical protein